MRSWRTLALVLATLNVALLVAALLLLRLTDAPVEPAAQLARRYLAERLAWETRDPYGFARLEPLVSGPEAERLARRHAGAPPADQAGPAPRSDLRLEGDVVVTPVARAPGLVLLHARYTLAGPGGSETRRELLLVQPSPAGLRVVQAFPVAAPEDAP